MAIIERNGNYNAVVRANGKQVWRSGGKSRKRAQQLEAELKTDIRRGSYKELTKARFEEFVQMWQRDYVSARLKRSTQDEYASYLKKHLLPVFSGMQMSRICRHDIDKYISQKLAEGCAPKSVRNQLTCLSSIFSKALAWRYVSENPVLGGWPEKQSAEGKHLSPEDIRKLLAASPEPWRTLFLAAVFTGMRQGELLGLTWGCVDFEEEIIRVEHGMYKGQLDTPKTKASRRKIPMTPQLRDALLDHKISAPASEMDLVFSRTHGEPLCKRTVTAAFQRALTAAGLAKIRFHDLRHSFASVLIESGASPKIVQELMGHSSVNMTLGIYTHVFDEQKQLAVGKFGLEMLGQSPGATHE